MKIQSKFVILGVALIVTVIACEGLNHLNNTFSDKQEQSIKLMQRHMDADMKHDGIRGNVYSAMVALKTGDAELLKESREEFNQMSDEFTKDVEDNLAADLPADIHDQFEKIKGSVQSYTDFSKKIGHAADFDQATAMLPEFNRVFGVLEEDQGKATDMILAWSAKLHDDSEAVSMYFNVALAILLGLSIIVPMFAIFAVFRPLSRMVGVMGKLSGGDTAINVTYAEDLNEMGDMARAVQVFKDNALNIEKLNVERESKIEFEARRRDAVHAMVAQFDASAKTIAGLVAASATELAQTAEGLVDTMGKTVQTTQSATADSTQTIMNVQSVASAAEELSASVREISGQLQKANQLVVSSREKAESADGLAKDLTTASDKVAGAMQMIATIAGQINLLALNATIESARAGEAGKGFAVVASEVKNLASQTDKSVAEIQLVIEEMRAASNAIVSALNEIKHSVGSITEATSSVAAAVEEQSATTNEIVRNMQTAASGTRTISDNLGEVNNSSSQAGHAAGQMLQATQELSRQAEQLNAQVDEFLDKMKAA